MADVGVRHLIYGEVREWENYAALLACNLHYYLAHGALRQPGERTPHIFEWENAVYYRPLTALRHTPHDFRPNFLRRRRCVIMHRNPADSVAAEE